MRKDYKEYIKQLKTVKNKKRPLLKLLIKTADILNSDGFKGLIEVMANDNECKHFLGRPYLTEYSDYYAEDYGGGDDEEAVFDALMYFLQGKEFQTVIFTEGRKDGLEDQFLINYDCIKELMKHGINVCLAPKVIGGGIAHMDVYVDTGKILIEL